MDGFSIKALALGVGGIVVAVLTGVFKDTLREFFSHRRLARRIRSWLRGEVPAKGEHFTVLVADLDGDDSGRAQTRHVTNAFEGINGFRQHQVGRCLSEEEFGDREEARLKAEANGQRWLDEFNAEVLIWGKVIPGGKGLILRFLGREGAFAPVSAETGEHRPGHYALGDTGLPLDFNKDMNTIIIALAAAAVAPVTERAGQYLAEILEPTAVKLRHLCAHMPVGLDDDQRGGLWHALGLAALTLGKQKIEPAWLKESVSAYRAALDVWRREHAALKWAKAQNNLGVGLT